MQGPFKMQVICSKCGKYIRTVPSWQPGTSHGLCDRCLRAGLHEVWFAKAFMFWRGGSGAWWMLPVMGGIILGIISYVIIF